MSQMPTNKVKKPDGDANPSNYELRSRASRLGRLRSSSMEGLASPSNSVANRLLVFGARNTSGGKKQLRPSRLLRSAKPSQCCCEPPSGATHPAKLRNTKHANLSETSKPASITTKHVTDYHQPEKNNDDSLDSTGNEGVEIFERISYGLVTPV